MRVCCQPVYQSHNRHLFTIMIFFILCPWRTKLCINMAGKATAILQTEFQVVSLRNERFIAEKETRTINFTAVTFLLFICCDGNDFILLASVWYTCSMEQAVLQFLAGGPTCCVRQVARARHSFRFGRQIRILRAAQCYICRTFLSNRLRIRTKADYSGVFPCFYSVCRWLVGQVIQTDKDRHAVHS